MWTSHTLSRQLAQHAVNAAADATEQQTYTMHHLWGATTLSDRSDGRRWELVLEGRSWRMWGFSVHTGADWLSVEMCEGARFCHQQLILHRQRYRKISRQRRTSCKNTHTHTHSKTMQLLWLTLTPVKYPDIEKRLTEIHIKIEKSL